MSTTDAPSPGSAATCVQPLSPLRFVRPLLDGDGRAADAETLRARVRALEDEVSTLQRSAMLGTLSAMVAHEFNNLMTPVLARAQVAQLTGDAAAVRKALDSAVVNSQKAIAITAHLLGLVRGDGDTSRAADVAAGVARVLDTMPRPLERDGVQVELDVPAGLSVAAAPLLFEQVLLNLVLNARTALHGRTGTLRISAAADDGSIRIEVCDTGIGMPAERIERVVNPFLAADPLDPSHDWRSVGLGLNVCRTIAIQHGATLRFRANSGAGCTAVVRWPAA